MCATETKKKSFGKIYFEDKEVQVEASLEEGHFAITVPQWSRPGVCSHLNGAPASAEPFVFSAPPPTCVCGRACLTAPSSH